MAVTVYSKPACVQCNATARALDKQGITYSVVDMSQDADALERVRAMGYMQAPVVMTESDHWSGFRPDKIAALADSAASSVA
ncbi:MAG: glutaredoxin-like protein NrdH [Micrococcaceae bacterium]